MDLSKKMIIVGLVLVFILTAMATFSFAIGEKDYIYQALKLIDEEKNNEAVEELEKAIALVRSKSNLELDNVIFTKEKATGFGGYNQRENAIFAPGETIFIYFEVKNHTIKENKDGLYEIYFKEDLYILDQDNNVLWGQANFAESHTTSHSKNNDFFLYTLVTQIDPFPVGNWKFRLVLKDVFSQKTTEATIDFTIAE